MLQSVKYVLTSDSNELWKFEEKRSNGENSNQKSYNRKTPLMSRRVVRDAENAMRMNGAPKIVLVHETCATRPIGFHMSGNATNQACSITFGLPVIREYPMCQQWGEGEGLTFDADG